MRAPHALALVLTLAGAAVADDAPLDPHRAAHEALVTGDFKGALERLEKASPQGTAGAFLPVRLGLARVLAGAPDAAAHVRVIRDRPLHPAAQAWTAGLEQLLGLEAAAQEVEARLAQADEQSKAWQALLEAERVARKGWLEAENAKDEARLEAARVAVVKSSIDRAAFARDALERLGKLEGSTLSAREWWTARRELLERWRAALDTNPVLLQQTDTIKSELTWVRKQLDHATQQVGSSALDALVGDLLVAALERVRGGGSAEPAQVREAFLAGYRRALEQQGLSPGEVELRSHCASLERDHLDRAQRLAMTLSLVREKVLEVPQRVDVLSLTGTAKARDALAEARRAARQAFYELDLHAVRLFEAEARIATGPRR